MRKILVFVAIFGAFTAGAQSWVASLPHVISITGHPSNSGSWVRLNVSNGRFYQWNPSVASWTIMPFGIDELVSGSAPNYSPSYDQSTFAIVKISGGDSLYHYRDGAWHHINKGGGGGGFYTAGTGIAISGGNVISNTGDLDPMNEVNTAFGVSAGTLNLADAGGTFHVAVTDIAPLQGVTNGAGISISGTTTKTITNTGDLSSTNELNTSFSVVGANLRLVDAAGNLDVPITNIAPIQNLVGGTGITISGAGSAKTITNSAPDQTVTITGAGINAVTGTYPNFTITGTEVDGSTTNEIQSLSLTGQSLGISLGGSGVTLPVVGVSSGTGIGVSNASGVFTVTNTGDLSSTNELQDLSLSGQSLGISSGSGVTLPIVGVTAGFGTIVNTSSGVATVKVDTTAVPSTYGTASVYRLWPKGNVTSYQPSTAKRNWLIYNQNIQSTSTRNAFLKFDTITSAIGSTTNGAGNGIWLATSTSVADMVSGFSNQIQHGGGFNLFGSGSINFTDWRQSGTRGSVLKCLNWSDGTGDAAVSFFRSQTADVRLGLNNMLAGEEIAAIRFAAADTTQALSTTKQFAYPQPCSAVVGYVYKNQFHDAHYGGVGIWVTNGSLTQTRAVAIDSTFSTTVRTGINTTPAPGNTLQVNGKTSLGGDLVLNTAGNKISVATGTNASAGSATLIGGSVTVNTTAVTANSIVIAICKKPIVTQGILSVDPADIVPGTSFKIKSTSVADASTLSWWIIN